MQTDFLISDPELCYLDGNSLGRLPRKAAERVMEVVYEGWGKQLIGGWNADWIDLPQRIGAKLAQLLSCKATEVIMADSTSVNLYKLATAALIRQRSRSQVLTDAANFPSDFYILESAIKSAGVGQKLDVVGTPEAIVTDTDEIIARIDHDTALVSLSHVSFKSGQLYDLQAITSAAHAVGALVLWDLSHSVGAVPIDLSKTQVDLAVGCTYKYLCGGPGAPAFIYCRQGLQTELQNPIAGWFSHQRPFDFEREYASADGIEKFLTGTPPVLSLVAIEAGVDLVLEVGMEQLRARSIELSERMLTQLAPRLGELGFELRSPNDWRQRGSHISIGHPEARRITETLLQRYRVVPDFRSPDNIRLGFAPLYTTPQEVDFAVESLVRVASSREYETIELPNAKVT